MLFGSNGNNWSSGITDMLAIPKLKFSIKKAQSNGFSGVTDKKAIPNWFGTSENFCIYMVGSASKGHKALCVRVRISTYYRGFRKYHMSISVGDFAIFSVIPKNPLLWTFLRYWKISIWGLQKSPLFPKIRYFRIRYFQKTTVCGKLRGF